MKASKIAALIEQKEKLEKQIKIETEKRLNEIGRLAKKESVHTWTNEALSKLFKDANELGEDSYTEKKEESVIA